MILSTYRNLPQQHEIAVELKMETFRSLEGRELVVLAVVVVLVAGVFTQALILFFDFLLPVKRRKKKRQNEDSAVESIRQKVISGAGDEMSKKKRTNVYEGDSDTNGKKQGAGKLTYANGSTYEGSWLDDLQHGKGMAISRNGDAYTGSWQQGVRHGEGEMVYKDGSVYVGCFQGK